MKVLIFALDGLEHDFVEEWRLKNLQQKEYGKVSIPRVCYKYIKTWRDEHAEAFTPYVWYSFITGKLPPLPQAFYKRDFCKFLYRSLRDILLLLYAPRKNYTQLFDDIRIFAEGREVNLDKKHLRDNIFEYAKKWVAIDFPFISPTWTMKIPLERGEEFNINTILNNLLKNFQTTRRLTLDKVRQDWDLFVIYTKLLDNYGELCYGDLERLRKVYFIVDDFVEEISSFAEEQKFCLVVSDHGITHFYGSYGKHSDHAFYSASEVLNLKNPSILDFKQIIIRKLRDET